MEGFLPFYTYANHYTQTSLILYLDRSPLEKSSLSCPILPIRAASSASSRITDSRA